MQEWFARWGLLELSGLTVTVRLLLAAVCGGVLGLERTRKRRAAGCARICWCASARRWSC